MVYRPTRQTTIKLTPSSPVAPQGLFDQAKATQNLGANLGAVARTLMDKKFESEENADVTTALLESVKVVNQDGSINPDMVDPAKFVWSNRATQTYLKNRDRTLASWADSELNEANKLYLAADPTGTNEQAKSVYDKKVADLRNSLTGYDIALADFNMREQKYNGGVAVSQAVETEKRENETLLNMAVSGATNLIEDIGVRIKGNGLASVDLAQITKDFEAQLTTIKTSPLSLENRDRQINQLQKNMQQMVALSQATHIANQQAEEARKPNGSNTYSPARAFEEMALSIERKQGYLEQIVGPNVDVDMVDRSVLAENLRQQANIYRADQTRKNQDIDRINKPKIDRISLDILNTITSASLDIIQNNLSATLDQIPLRNRIEVELALATDILRQRQRIKQDNNAEWTATQKRLANELEPSISIMQNGGTSDEITAAIATLNQAMPSLYDYPAIRASISNAFKANMNRGQASISGSLELIAAQIKANSYGHPDNPDLIDRGNRLAESLSGQEGTERAIAGWINFKTTSSQAVQLDQIDADIENIRNGNPLQHFANEDDLTNAITISASGRLDSFNSAVNKRLTDEFKDDLVEAQIGIEARFNPSNVDLNFSPESLRQAIFSVEEKFKESKEPLLVEELVARLESHFDRYQAAYSTKQSDVKRLGAIQLKAAKSIITTSDIAHVEKMTDIPTYNPNSQDYRDFFFDYYSMYGVLPKDFQEQIEKLPAMEEDAASQVLTLLNEGMDKRARDTGRKKATIYREFTSYLTSTSGMSDQSNIRGAQMLRLMLQNVPYQQAMEESTKGNGASANQAFKSLFYDFQGDPTNDDFFNLFKDNVKEMSEDSVFQDYVLDHFGSSESRLEKRAEQYWSSQFDHGSTWFFQQLAATPEVKYRISSLMKSEIRKAAQVGQFDKSSLIGVIYSVMDKISGNYGIQWEPAGYVTFGQMVEAQGMYSGSATDPVEFVDTALATASAATVAAAQALGAPIDSRIMQPRLVKNPIQDHMKISTPEIYQGMIDEVLEHDVIMSVRSLPDGYFNSRGEATNAEVLKAVREGMIFYQSNNLLGDTANPSYTVYTRLRNGQTVTVFDEYSPSWEKMSSFGVIDKQTGARIKNLPDSVGLILSSNAMFGPMAMREAYSNFLSSEANMELLGSDDKGASYLNVLSNLRKLAGFPRLQTPYSEDDLVMARQLFDLVILDR